MKSFRIKIRCSLIVFSILVSTCAYSQTYKPLPDSNARWIVNEYDSDFSTDFIYSLSSYFNDTIINSIPYTKVYIYWVPVDGLNPGNCLYSSSQENLKRYGYRKNGLDPFYLGAYRNSPDGKTFFFPRIDEGLPQEEVLLHDFTANAGDTIRNIAIHSMFDQFTLFDCIVDSVNFRINGPYTHKYLYLTPVDYFPHYMGNSLIWVEKIGSLNNGLFNSLECYAVTDALVCMSSSDTTYYTNNDLWPNCFYYGFNLVYESGDCLVPNGIGNEDNKSISGLAVYPNPASIYVIFEPQKVVQSGTITIADITGRPITSFPLTGEKTVWQTEGVKPGVYLYHLQTLDGGNSGRFLITP